MLAARQGPTPERLSLSELFSLFNRTVTDTRWLSSADSLEYLNVVTYLVNQISKED